MREANEREARVAKAGWEKVDDKLNELSGRKNRLDAELGRWLLTAHEMRVDRRLGFASFEEYAGRKLGEDARQIRERLRVARALEQLPMLKALTVSGARPWSAARELVRVAVPATEATWIARTESMTVRQIEAEVRGRKRGDLPTDEKDPLLEPRRLRFSLMPEAFALVMEAFEKMRTEVGSAKTDTEVLCAMAESFLGKRPETRAAYQTHLTVCVACERTWQTGGGELVEVPSHHAGCGRCDGELVGWTHVDEGVAGPHAASAITQDSADVHPTHEEDREGSGVAHSEAPTTTHVDRDVSIDPTLRKVLGARQLMKLAARVFDIPRRSLTPKLRAAVRGRDQGRCVVPGCTNFRHVDVHHIVMRSHGGPNTLENCVVLCTRHHQAVHAGLLAIEGSPSKGLIVRHAGGTLYGMPRPLRPNKDDVDIAAFVA